MIKPKCLKKGSRIMTLSSSRGGPSVFPERYKAGKNQLEEEFGVTVVEGKYALRDAQRLYHNPEARAEDFNNAFSDSSVDGIISTIGGDDSIRMLPYVDIDNIRSNPKVFIGYSDTTISHFTCFKAGLTTFYGPSIMAGFGENCGLFDYMVANLHKTVFSSKKVGELKSNTQEWTNERLSWADGTNQGILRKRIPAEGWRRIQGETIVSGELLGGCLDVLPFMYGTSIRPDREIWRGKVLFIEPSEEQMSTEAFERIIRNLGSQGILSVINGILLGRSQYDYELESQINYDESLLKIVAGELGINSVPIITNMDFGHTDPMLVLPYGLSCTIDCNSRKVIVDENCCI